MSVLWPRLTLLSQKRNLPTTGIRIFNVQSFIILSTSACAVDGTVFPALTSSPGTCGFILHHKEASASLFPHLHASSGCTLVCSHEWLTSQGRLVPLLHKALEKVRFTSMSCWKFPAPNVLPCTCLLRLADGSICRNAEVQPCSAKGWPSRFHSMYSFELFPIWK